MATFGQDEKARGKQDFRLTGWHWYILILGPIVLGIGCNPITTLSFLLQAPFGETRFPPACQIAAKHKEVTVVILTSLAYRNDIRPEFLTVDRDLTDRLIQQLRKRYEENREKVNIVPFSKVNRYLAQQSDTSLLAKQEIGKHFHADYVINLEINAISLYEKGSIGEQLFRGTADIEVTVIDVKQPQGEDPIFTRNYTCQYPENMPEFASSTTVGDFSSKFLGRLAWDLSKFFAGSSAQDKYDK